MKINTSHLLNQIKNITEQHNNYIQTIEICKDEIKLHGETECPNWIHGCPEHDIYGQCTCTNTEGITHCMYTIKDNEQTYKYIINDEHKYNLHYPKTICIDTKIFTRILETFIGYDCTLKPGQITFIEENTMKPHEKYTFKISEVKL